MTKTSANIGFEKQLWDAACVLWGHIPAAEYRKVIIGLIFLRYISAAFDKRYQELVEEGDGFEDDRDAYTMENVFFVPEEARWSTIASAAHTAEIGTVIDNAMRAIEAENKTLKNVLPLCNLSPIQSHLHSRRGTHKSSLHLKKDPRSASSALPLSLFPPHPVD